MATYTRPQLRSLTTLLILSVDRYELHTGLDTFLPHYPIHIILCGSMQEKNGIVVSHPDPPFTRVSLRLEVAVRLQLHFPLIEIFEHV